MTKEHEIRAAHEQDSAIFPHSFGFRARGKLAHEHRAYLLTELDRMREESNRLARAILDFRDQLGQVVPGQARYVSENVAETRLLEAVKDYRAEDLYKAQQASPGLDWKLSDEAAKDIVEIERHGKRY